MEKQSVDHRSAQGAKETSIPNLTKPVWQDQQMTCKQCRFCGQDVDCYPCDRCHTRH